MKIIAGIFVLTCLVAGTCLAQTNEADWQQAEGATVRLCVRDKYGMLGGYRATFIVTDHSSGPNGKSYQKIIPVAADDLGCVRFPIDFSGAGEEIYMGKYKWSCMVNNKNVAGGSFEFKPYFEVQETEKRKRRRSKR